MAVVPISVLAIAAAVSLGCGGGRPDTESNVKAALAQANMGDVDVTVDEDEHVVLLHGTVDTISERTRAEEVAAAAVGTSGRVLNELTVTSLDEPDAGDADSRITSEIDRRLDADPIIKERDVNIDVNEGVVTVIGEVRTPAEKVRVTRIVREVPGVKDVANVLAINREH